MTHFYTLLNARAFRAWAPFAARLILAGVFLFSAVFKIPGTESFAMQVGMAGAVGVPFPYLAVLAAFVLEIVAGAMLIIGWHARVAALALIVLTALIAFFFVTDLSDQAQWPVLFSCLELIAGLLFIATYGARSIAMRQDG